MLTVENMRLADRATMAREGIDEIALVKRVAEAIMGYRAWAGRIAVACGKGNNGADGMALAGVLAARGADVTVYCVEGKRSPACAYYRETLPKKVKVVEIDETTRIEGYDIVFDCLLGTGFEGVPKGAAAWGIRAVNESGATVVSVDIASGLNADSGMAELCVKSDLTLSIGGYKAGNLLNMAKDTYRTLDVLEVGIVPVTETYGLAEAADVKAALGERKHFSNKGDYGYIALVGGSLPYSGAVRLAAMAAAAMRSGAGVAKVATAKSLCPLLVPQILESTLYPLCERDGQIGFDREEIERLVGNVKAVAFGMGVGTGEGAKAILAYLLENYAGRLVVDADGLTLLSQMDADFLRRRKCTLVLTPHVKEFGRLTGMSVEDIFAHFAEYAVDYAKAVGAVVLLKGATTVVTDGKRVALVDAGAPGMATAGSGDVLSGVLAATLGYVEDAWTATYAAAYINGKAGEAAQAKVGATSMIASDTVREIAGVIGTM